jgi:hypothetical protein
VTWVKLDDHFHDHPKIEALSSDAYRAFVGGLCYCARYLTDGSIPAPRVLLLAPKGKTVIELTDAGLWQWNGNGVKVHDYLDFQEDSATVLERRRKDSERKRGGK